MSEKQSDEHIIPIVVVGEYDSEMGKTPEGSPSIADVKNNSEKLPVFGKLGQAAVRAAVRAAESAANYLNSAAKTGREYIGEHTGADARKSTSEGSETLATSDSNTSPEKNTSDGAKSTSEKQAPGANESKTEKSKVNTPQVEKTSDGAKSTSEKQAPGANESKTEKSKVNTPQVEKTSDGTKSTSEGTTDTSKPNAKPEAKKSKDDASQVNKNTSDGAKSTSGEQASGAAADFMKKFLDESKQDQESSAAGSSEDKQDKDSNPNTGEAQTKETRTSPEKREAATNLKNAKDRHAKASAAAKSKNPLGRKKRQAELKAATEQLKKCELLDKAADKLDESRERFAKASVDVESHFFKRKKRQEELNAATEELKKSGLGYMRLKFADKIEAAKQDPEKQAELAAEMAQAAFASMQETSRVTADKYDNMLDDRSEFKKAVAQVGKWFNKGGRIAQCLKPGVAGFVAGTATGFFAGYAGFPITTAVGAVTGLGFAGLTKQAVLEERRGEDRIGEARLETIEPSFEKAVANMKIDDVMEHAVNVSVDNLKDVSIERQDALHKKVKSSLGKYGIGFALGGVFGSSINHLWNNSAHATGTEGNADATPQSGSEQTPQSGGASSADNSAAKAIVDNINPDTSNFNSYDYPWDWAAEKFGNANAMDQLHNLADKAMANGHTVQWFNNPDGSVWMKVDGSSATADVLKVLNKYA